MCHDMVRRGTPIEASMRLPCGREIRCLPALNASLNHTCRLTCETVRAHQRMTQRWGARKPPPRLVTHDNSAPTQGTCVEHRACCCCRRRHVSPRIDKASLTEFVHIHATDKCAWKLTVWAVGVGKSDEPRARDDAPAHGTPQISIFDCQPPCSDLSRVGRMYQVQDRKTMYAAMYS